jgi:uncharacterized membrane protein
MATRAFNTPLRRVLTARPRLYFSSLIGIAVGAVLPPSMGSALRAIIGWDVASGLYLILAFIMMLRSNPRQLRRRAFMQYDTRWVILGLVAGSAVATLFAIGQVLGNLREMPIETVYWHVGLSGFTLISSWMLVNVIFAQAYAYEYFGPRQRKDGPTALAFPDDEQPDYWDFMYFSMCIGMTCQVSDVAIRSRVLRRVATVHAMLSFFYNTVILALTVNIAASLL